VDHAGWYKAPPATAQVTAVMPVVQEAVWTDRRLQLRYRHGDGEVRRYLVDPYGLVVKAGVWYLVAAHRGASRLWRVDRAQEALLVADAPSRRPPGLDLAAEWERLRADVERPRESIRVDLRVRPGLVPMVLRVTTPQRSSAASATGTVIEPGAATTTELDADGSTWVRMQLDFRAPGAAVAALLGFGGDVEVVGPAQVRERLVATAHAALARYPGPSQDQIGNGRAAGTPAASSG